MMGIAMRTLGTLLLIVGLVILLLMASVGFTPFGIFVVVVCFSLGITCHVSAPRGGDE